MRYIIVDLEASCWESSMSRDKMEIIEIGAVKLASSAGPVSGEFDSFVRPVVDPTLSVFCTQLTGIRQEDVETADPFPVVLNRFLRWIGSEPFRLCSWGAYDLGQFQLDCRRLGIPFPASFESHINLKQEFSKLYATRPQGMKGALAIVGLPLEGQHHQGIDDARNIAKLAQLILPPSKQIPARKCRSSLSATCRKRLAFQKARSRRPFPIVSRQWENMPGFSARKSSCAVSKKRLSLRIGQGGDGASAAYDFEERRRIFPLFPNVTHAIIL